MSVLTEGEVVTELPLTPVWFGIIALIVFAALLAITWAFRGVWHRHDSRAFEATRDQGSSHGAGGH